MRAKILRDPVQRKNAGTAAMGTDETTDRYQRSQSQGRADRGQQDPPDLGTLPAELPAGAGANRRSTSFACGRRSGSSDRQSAHSWNRAFSCGEAPGPLGRRAIPPALASPLRFLSEEDFMQEHRPGPRRLMRNSPSPRGTAREPGSRGCLPVPRSSSTPGGVPRRSRSPPVARRVTATHSRV